MQTGRLRLAVDRSFSLPGTGTIVTGTVFAGEVRVGDKFLLSPSGIAARVRWLHAKHEPVELGRAGQRCSPNLVGAEVEKDRIKRGDRLLDEALDAPTDRIDARIRLLPIEDRSLRHLTAFPPYRHRSSPGMACDPRSREASSGGRGVRQAPARMPTRRPSQ